MNKPEYFFQQHWESEYDTQKTTNKQTNKNKTKQKRPTCNISMTSQIIQKLQCSCQIQCKNNIWKKLISQSKVESDFAEH
jgi:hypothetical protein